MVTFTVSTEKRNQSLESLGQGTVWGTTVKDGKKLLRNVS